MSMGERSRVFVGGALLLIGIVAALSAFMSLEILGYAPKDPVKAMAVPWLATASSLYGTHFVLMAVAGWLIVRASKRAVWFLWLSVFTWAIAVSVEVSLARRWAIEQGREQIRPVLAVFLSAVSDRSLSVFPSFLGLIFMEARRFTENRSRG